MEKKFKISIIGDGYTFEREVTKELADKISMQILSGAPTVSAVNLEEPVNNSQDSHKRRHRPGSKKKILPKVEIREVVSSITLDPNSQNYGNYWRLPTKGDKILWLLAMAKLNKVDSVYQKEITLLSTKVGDHIETKAITPLIIPHKRAGRLVDFPDEKGIKMVRILHPGEEYLESREVKKK